MELNEIQKELVAVLTEKGLSREDLFSVMLMLTKEEKARDFLLKVKEKEKWDAEELRRLCAEIAFRDTENAEKI